MLTTELHNRAMAAAETATNDHLNKYGDHDACGFAWVTAYVNGASWARALRHRAMTKHTAEAGSCGTPARAIRRAYQLKKLEHRPT